MYRVYIEKTKIESKFVTDAKEKFADEKILLQSMNATAVMPGSRKISNPATAVMPVVAKYVILPMVPEGGH